jgi:hypothetical protein
MSSEQLSMSSILSQLRLFQWNFQIPIQYTQSDIVSLSCISLSVEEARHQIISMLTKFEQLVEEKNILEKEKNNNIRYSTGKEYFDHELSYYKKIKQMYQCDIIYQPGCKDSSMSPHDYTLTMKVINSHSYTYQQDLISLQDLIKTVEPQINPVNLVSFHVGTV